MGRVRRYHAACKYMGNLSVRLPKAIWRAVILIFVDVCRVPSCSIVTKNITDELKIDVYQTHEIQHSRDAVRLLSILGHYDFKKSCIADLDWDDHVGADWLSFAGVFRDQY